MERLGVAYMGNRPKSRQRNIYIKIDDLRLNFALILTIMLKRASTKIAHNSTIPVLGANQELKPLQNLITAEKAVLVS